MADKDVEREREAAIELLTSAYAKDVISLDQLESRLAAVTDAQSSDAVRSIVGDLGDVTIETRSSTRTLAFPEAQQLIRGSMQSLRREGRWLRSHRVLLAQTGSSIRLDLSEIEDFPGEAFELDMALKGCSCRIKVPRGTRIEEHLEPHMSSYRCSRQLRRGEERGAPTLVITGRVVASSIRISPSRRARGTR